jgi:hypothetical protein
MFSGFTFCKKPPFSDLTFCRQDGPREAKNFLEDNKKLPLKVIENPD